MAAEMSWEAVNAQEGRGRAHAFRNSGPVGVPAGGVLEVPILVFGIREPLADVSVSLHVRHRAIGMLRISLVSPDGRATLLSALEGGDGVCLGESPARPIVFTDEAPIGIEDGLAPFAGPHRPRGRLAALRGLRPQAANGCWRIVVGDIGPGPQGALIASAALTFRV